VTNTACSAAERMADDRTTQRFDSDPGASGLTEDDPATRDPGTLGPPVAGAADRDRGRPDPDPGAPHPAGDLFRDAMAALASGVAVVTARRADGRPAGLLATSIAAYSARPPSILVSVAHSSRSHPVLVVDAELFGVHLLARAQEETARVFASRVHDKYANLGWDWDREVPRLAGVVSYLRCRRSAVFDRYDHSILIGDILGGHHAGGEPLLWVRRRMDWRLSPEG
jgi:flavin reductase (DIM6/NTAB) family NADH-FMN oxidoreductase RutF